jgi:hypothetical protein
VSGPPALVPMENQPLDVCHTPFPNNFQKFPESTPGVIGHCIQWVFLLNCFNLSGKQSRADKMWIMKLNIKGHSRKSGFVNCIRTVCFSDEQIWQLIFKMWNYIWFPWKKSESKNFSLILEEKKFQYI